MFSGTVIGEAFPGITEDSLFGSTEENGMIQTETPSEEEYIFFHA